MCGPKYLSEKLYERAMFVVGDLSPTQKRRTQMGLFNDISSTETSSAIKDELSIAYAFTAIPLAMSAIDGNIDEKEMECVGTYIERMRIFKDYDNEQIAAMFAKLLDILDRKGVANLVKAAKMKLPIPLRETAFASAVDVAFADGVLEDHEKKLLKELYKFLELSDKTATMIIKVAAIRNRGYGQW
jgi:tellurite resistance protein